MAICWELQEGFKNVLSLASLAQFIERRPMD